MTFISTCLIIIGIYWIYFSALSFMQGVRLNNTVVEYEPLGRVLFGRDARFLASRANVILAYDEKTGEIRGAKKIRPAFIVIPHRTTSLDQLVGKNLKHLDPHNCGVDQRTAMALENILKQL